MELYNTINNEHQSLHNCRVIVCDSERFCLPVSAYALLLFPVLGQGVNQNTRKFVLTAEKRACPACILPPYRNNKNPEALISQDFRASMGKKKDHADCIKYCVVTWWSIPDSNR